MLPLMVDLFLDGLSGVHPLVLGKVLEPALGLQPIHDRKLLLLALGYPLAVTGEGELAVLILIQGPDTCVDRQSGHVYGSIGLVPPSTGTGGDDVKERRTTALEALTSLGDEVLPVVRSGLCRIGRIVGSDYHRHVLGMVLLARYATAGGTGGRGGTVGGGS